MCVTLLVTVPFEVNSQTFTGTTTLDGAVVINESSADVDLRVESNLDTHSLFVQGSSGNLRYGGDVEPRAWNSTFRAMDVGGGGSLWSTKAASSMVQLSSNTHWNGSNYVATATGSGGRYYQDSGDHVFLGAPSVSAGVNQAFVTTMSITEEGIVTKPLQPAVQAHVASTQSNIEAGALYTIPFATEVFDQNSDFNNSNFTFTAPVTGKYMLSVAATIGGMPLAAALFSISHCNITW